MNTIEKIIRDNRYKRGSKYARSHRPKWRRIGKIMLILYPLDMLYLFIFVFSALASKEQFKKNPQTYLSRGSLLESLVEE